MHKKYYARPKTIFYLSQRTLPASIYFDRDCEISNMISIARPEPVKATYRYLAITHACNND
jgi:hypothetical protein